VAHASPAVLNGVWRLTLRSSSFAVTKDGKAAVGGRIRLAGSTITFSDVAGPFRCTGSQRTGSYRWSLKGSALRLSPLREPCAGRRLVLARTFRKVA